MYTVIDRSLKITGVVSFYVYTARYSSISCPVFIPVD